MPTVSFNKNTQVLKFDLSAAETASADQALPALSSRFETALTNLLRDLDQQARDQDLARLRRAIESLPAAKRTAILAIVDAP
jgi:hypothetical protein